MQHSRSNNADAAFPLRISQTLHSPGSLIERGQTGSEVGWITTVCKHQHTEIQSKAPSLKGCIYKTRLRKDYSPAGISASRPEISLRASAHREVESAIILTWQPISRKYSDRVIPVTKTTTCCSSERNSMLICCQKDAKKPNYLSLHFDGNRQWKLLFLPTLCPCCLFFCCYCLFLLTLLIFVYEPFTCISLKRHCNVTDATLSLTETMNKNSSYCKMSPSLSNHQNTRVRKGCVLSELSDKCS